MSFDFIIKISVDKKAYEKKFNIKFNTKIFQQAIIQILDSFDTERETMKIEVIHHGEDKNGND